MEIHAIIILFTESDFDKTCVDFTKEQGSMNEMVEFSVLPDTSQAISETSLTRQSTNKVLIQLIVSCCQVDEQVVVSNVLDEYDMCEKKRSSAR